MTLSSGPAADHGAMRETSCLTCLPARIWTSSATRPGTCCAARRGDPDAVARIQAVSGQIMLSAAQLAVAREYGFASWVKMKLEVERRDILNSRDLSRLTRLLAEHPELATAKLEPWHDHPN